MRRLRPLQETFHDLRCIQRKRTKKRSSGRFVTAPEEKRICREANLFSFATVAYMIYQVALTRNGNVFWAFSQAQVA